MTSVAALSRRLGALVAGVPGDVVGIEQEYIVRVADRSVDFRTLLHRLPVPGRRMDPADRHAYRTTSGLSITCDGAEAEIATPPIALFPGFAGHVSAWAERGATQLAGLLPLGFSLEGCSTHLSVSSTEPDNPAVCGLFARTFAPALMLLMDGRDAEGLLVRPRWGRAEFGGDFVSGPALRAAAVLAAGGIAACRLVTGGRAPHALLPPAIHVNLDPAIERFGWYVDRRAFGLDLYVEGRDARLRRERRGRITAQDHLELAWKSALEALAGGLHPDDVAHGDALATGVLPLPCEQAPSRAPAVPSSTTPASTVFGDLLRDRERPGFGARAVVATWDTTVFAIEGSRRAFTRVPRAALPGFLHALDAGELDGLVTAYLATPATGRVAANGSAAAVGLYDLLGPVGHLAAPERDATGMPRSLGDTAVLERPAESTTAPVENRPGKGLAPPPPLVHGSGLWPFPFLWWGLGAALIAVLVLVASGGGVEVEGIDEDGGLIFAPGGEWWVGVPPLAGAEEVRVTGIDLPGEEAAGTVRDGAWRSAVGVRLTVEGTTPAEGEGMDLGRPARITVAIPAEQAGGSPISDQGGEAVPAAAVVRLPAPGEVSATVLSDVVVREESGGLVVSGTTMREGTFTAFVVPLRVALVQSAASVEPGGTVSVTAMFQGGDPAGPLRTGWVAGDPLAVGGAAGAHEAVLHCAGAGRGTYGIRIAMDSGAMSDVLPYGIAEGPIEAAVVTGEVECGDAGGAHDLVGDFESVDVGGGTLPWHEAIALEGPSMVGPCHGRAVIPSHGVIDPEVSRGVYRVPRTGQAFYEGSIDGGGDGERAINGSVRLSTPVPWPDYTFGEPWDGITRRWSESGDVTWELSPRWTPATAPLEVTGTHFDTAGICRATVLVRFEGGFTDSPIGPISLALTLVGAGVMVLAGRPRG